MAAVAVVVAGYRRVDVVGRVGSRGVDAERGVVLVRVGVRVGLVVIVRACEMSVGMSACLDGSVAGRVRLTVRNAQSLQTLCAESVRGNLGEEDPIHCDHGDGGCPVLVLSARTSMNATT